jgi:hypothetical protein
LAYATEPFFGIDTFDVKIPKFANALISTSALIGPSAHDAIIAGCVERIGPASAPWRGEVQTQILHFTNNNIGTPKLLKMPNLAGPLPKVF